MARLLNFGTDTPSTRELCSRSSICEPLSLYVYFYSLSLPSPERERESACYASHSITPASVCHELIIV